MCALVISVDVPLLANISLEAQSRSTQSFFLIPEYPSIHPSTFYHLILLVLELALEGQTLKDSNRKSLARESSTLIARPLGTLSHP